LNIISFVENWSFWWSNRISINHHFLVISLILLIVIQHIVYFWVLHTHCHSCFFLKLISTAHRLILISTAQQSILIVHYLHSPDIIALPLLLHLVTSSDSYHFKLLGWRVLKQCWIPVFLWNHCQSFLLKTEYLARTFTATPSYSSCIILWQLLMTNYYHPSIIVLLLSIIFRVLCFLLWILTIQYHWRVCLLIQFVYHCDLRLVWRCFHLRLVLVEHLAAYFSSHVVQECTHHVVFSLQWSWIVVRFQILLSDRLLLCWCCSFFLPLGWIPLWILSWWCSFLRLINLVIGTVSCWVSGWSSQTVFSQWFLKTCCFIWDMLWGLRGQ
jgi:hypothetical protein